MKEPSPAGAIGSGATGPGSAFCDRKLKTEPQKLEWPEAAETPPACTATGKVNGAKLAT